MGEESVFIDSLHYEPTHEIKLPGPVSWWLGLIAEVGTRRQQIALEGSDVSLPLNSKRNAKAEP